MRLRMTVVAMLLVFVGATPEAFADFKDSLQWCIGNYSRDPGETNCPGDYVATYPECLTGGGRACLMSKAIQAAKANDCANAFRLAQICQCHNDGARDEIRAAGPQAVCDFLKTR